jgi:3-hydroxyisobutyrate dehydrogenase-like beta-hydroxyacid dehydrogenase
MSARVIEGPVGAASSIKMIRSVMVKGLEALTAECVLAAFAAGVEEEVLGSLMKSHPGTDWPKAAAYNFERSISHGERRAAEMEEVAKTLTDLGLFADVTEGTIRWQRRLAGAGVPIPHAPPEDGPMDVAVALLHALRSY